jgi:hypothetical protein
MRKRLTLVLILVLAVAMLGTALTYAGGGDTRRSGQHQGRGLNLCADLTDEQQTALREKVTEMKEDGATREEIHTTVGEMLHGFGVELPEDWDQRPRRGDGPFANLSDEQRNEIHQMVMDMKEAGASRAEIHEIVGTMLHGFGVELPEDWDQHQERCRHGFRRLCAGLTDEQRISIREMVMNMKESEVSRAQIHAAVGEKLRGYGIELPETWSLVPVPYSYIFFIETHI